VTIPLNQLPYTTGTANGVAISFNAGAHEWQSTRFVTLSQNYQRVIPVGYPDANAGSYVPTSLTAHPQTIASGKRVRLFAVEASAVVAAGAGSFS
jgi:hypothetical protein